MQHIYVTLTISQSTTSQKLFTQQYLCKDSEQWFLLKLVDLIHYVGLFHFIYILQHIVSILQSFRYYEKELEHFFGMLLNHKRPVKKQGETV